MGKVTTGQTYNKGAWVLHMLRNAVGNEAWWRGIRNYYRKYMNSHATTDNFRVEMEAVCECDLAQFFQQWLYQPGNLTLDGGWRYDSTSKTVEVSLSQSQPRNRNFAVDVEIGVFNSGDIVPAIHTVPLTARQNTVMIPVDSKPTSIVIDPRTILLAEWNFTESPQ